MSSKPESQFTKNIHKRFTNPPHFEKMHNPFRAGTWDVWYSGDRGDLWIEYKWLPKYPVRGQVIPALTAQQLDWGISRHYEGRKLAVIIGTPLGGIIFQTISQWESGMNSSSLPLLTQEEIAEWIYKKTGKAHDPSKGGNRSKNSRITL